MQCKCLTRFSLFYFQFEAIKNYLDKGGSILVLLGEGGETRFGTNINFLLEDFGIMVNNGEQLDISSLEVYFLLKDFALFFIVNFHSDSFVIFRCGC